MNKQQEDDLTWLARNVHRWPAGHQGWCYVTTYASGAKGVSTSRLMHPEAIEVTIDQWHARRAELQGKPSWAVIPKWAQWLAQEGDGYWYAYKDKPEIYEDRQMWNSRLVDSSPISNGSVLGDWRDTLERRPVDSAQLEQPVVVVGSGDVGSANAWRSLHEWIEDEDNNPQMALMKQVSAELHNDGCHSAWIHVSRFIEALFERIDDLETITDSVPDTNDEQSCHNATWHERGELPPVGAECVIWSDGRFPPEECKIVAYSMEQVCVRWNGSGDLDVIDLQFKSPSECKFRPIRSERDVLMEIIDSNFRDETYGLVPITEVQAIADAILAAGFTKTKE